MRERKGGTKGILDAGRGESEKAVERGPEKRDGVEKPGAPALGLGSFAGSASQRGMLTLDLN